MQNSHTQRELAKPTSSPRSPHHHPARALAEAMSLAKRGELRPGISSTGLRKWWGQTQDMGGPYQPATAGMGMHRPLTAPLHPPPQGGAGGGDRIQTLEETNKQKQQGHIRFS